jgi:hypothetical protein
MYKEQNCPEKVRNFCTGFKAKLQSATKCATTEKNRHIQRKMTSSLGLQDKNQLIESKTAKYTTKCKTTEKNRHIQRKKTFLNEKLGRCLRTNLTSAILQGNILGPLLLTIFINNLPETLSPESTAPLYADDSKVYRSLSSSTDCLALQQGLDHLDVWSHKNNLTFNGTKCKILTVSRKKNPCLFPYRLDGNKLAHCSEEIDFGMTITYNLKWDSHFMHIRSTANKSLGILRRTCYEFSIMVRTNY